MTDAAQVTGRDHGLVDIAVIAGGINGLASRAMPLVVG